MSETQVAALEQLLDRVRARASLPRTRLLLHGAHGDAASEAETGLAETGLAETGLAETGLVETGLAETGLVETGLAETGLAETGLAETGLAESGVTEIAEARPELSDIAVPALDEPTTETALVADEPTAEMPEPTPAVPASAEDIDVELDFDADEIEVTSDEMDSGVDAAPTTEVSAADIRPAEARPDLPPTVPPAVPPAGAEALAEPPTPVAAPAPSEAVATIEHGEPAVESEDLGAEAIEVTVDEVELSAPSEAPPDASVGEALAEQALPEQAPAEEAPAEEPPPEEAALEVGPAEVASPEAPAMATTAPVIDVPVPTELGREQSAIGASSEVATLRRAAVEPQSSVKTTTPGMPAPVLTSASETVTAKGAEPAGPPPLPSTSPERQPTAVDDTVTVGAPPPLPPEARASGLSPRAVVPERPTSARVGDFIGELEPPAAPSFGDALDASLALSF